MKVTDPFYLPSIHQATHPFAQHANYGRSLKCLREIPKGDCNNTRNILNTLVVGFHSICQIFFYTKKGN